MNERTGNNKSLSLNHEEEKRQDVAALTKFSRVKCGHGRGFFYMNTDLILM